ncbi:TetR/AcrR family transcriptional regulator [Streptomyces sp. NPDC001070]
MTAIGRATTAANRAGSADITGPAVRRGPRTRTDAVRNRERIMAAARAVFAEVGAAAPLEEIARRAGVGSATLYRHFRDRPSLLHAVLLSVMRGIAGHAERAAAENTDAFAALERFLHDAADERLGALCGLLLDKGEQVPAELSAQCARVQTAAGRLMDNARRDGRIRADVGLDDLLVAMSLLARPLPGTNHRDADVHRRLDLLISGLRVPASRGSAERMRARGSRRPSRTELTSFSGRHDHDQPDGAQPRACSSPNHPYTTPTCTSLPCMSHV